MNFRRPQSPLQHKNGDYFYPLTTADQIIMPDESRFNTINFLSADKENVKLGEASPLNADSLGGYPADKYLRKDQFEGKATINYIAPRNLLDNSDFTNPVNQRGEMSYSGLVYTIDRWRGRDYGSIVTIIPTSGINVTSGRILQVIDPLKIKANTVYTLSTMTIDGTIDIYTATFEVGSPGIRGTIFFIEDGSYIVRLDSECTYVWAALYEGEYTIDTLPEYQPKGYAVELAECRRYYQRISKGTLRVAGSSTQGQLFFTLPVPLRQSSTVPTANVIEGGLILMGTDYTEISRAGTVTVHMTNGNSGGFLEVTPLSALLGSHWHASYDWVHGIIEISADML